MDNPLSYIAPETFDRLTIIKGPQSVRWGAGASAGTVRFERDTPRFENPACVPMPVRWSVRATATTRCWT
jgi:iron complex outermembrane receptor protein